MTPRTGRPNRAAAAELEDRVRRAALDTFLEYGFDGASMEAVARGAGVTKRTLYAKYPDKRTLFAKVLTWAMSTMRWNETIDIEPDADLRTSLTTIGRAAVNRVVDPQVVQLSRMAMAESHRFPEFAEAAHSMAWSPRLRAVASVLDRHSATGDIVVDDAKLAAEQFLAMVSGFPAILAIYGLLRETSDEYRRVDNAVTLFLRGIEVRSH